MRLLEGRAQLLEEFSRSEIIIQSVLIRLDAERVAAVEALREEVATLKSELAQWQFSLEDKVRKSIPPSRPSVTLISNGFQLQDDFLKF